MPPTTLLKMLQVQLGKESPYGTPALPTKKLYAIDSFEITPEVRVQQFQELLGSLAPSQQAAIDRLGGTARLVLHGNYESIVYPWLGMLGDVAATGADPYTRAVDAPSDTIPTPRYHTYYYGLPDSGGQSRSYRLVGGVGARTVLTCTSAGKAQLTQDILGLSVRKCDVGVFGAALPNTAWNPAMGNHIGVAGGGIWIQDFVNPIASGLQVATRAFAFTLSLDGARTVFYTLGNIGGTDYVEQIWPIDNNTLNLRLQFERSAPNTAQYLDALVPIAGGLPLLSDMQRQIRVLLYRDASHQLQVDFAGTLSGSPRIFPDQDGVITVDLTFRAMVSTVLGNWLKTVLVNRIPDSQL